MPLSRERETEMTSLSQTKSTSSCLFPTKMKTSKCLTATLLPHLRKLRTKSIEVWLNDHRKTTHPD